MAAAGPHHSMLTGSLSSKQSHVKYTPIKFCQTIPAKGITACILIVSKLYLYIADVHCYFQYVHIISCILFSHHVTKHQLVAANVHLMQLQPPNQKTKVVYRYYILKMFNKGVCDMTGVYLTHDFQSK